MLRTICILLVLVTFTTALAAPLGTAFQYQGRLEMSGTPFDGNANLWFLVYDADEALVADLSLAAVPVDAGLFSVELDFGPIFDGSALFMEIQVLTGGDPDWTVLSPRVPILAAPYAMHALNGGGASPWELANGALTFFGGSVGVTNWSAPITAGNGVFFEGGFPNHASVFAFDYNMGHPQNLLLNAPGGNVGIGSLAPLGKLHVQASDPGPAIYANNSSLAWATMEVHNASSWGTSIHATAPDNGRGVDSWASGSGWAVVGSHQAAGTFGLLGTAIEGVAGFSSNASIPAGRFTNSAFGGLGLEVSGLASVKSLRITGGADLAERFDASEPAVPGTVMAIDPRHPGHMMVCDQAYCTRVAGVVSGARDLAAGVVLGEHGGDGGVEIALSGRVWAQCDTSNGGIEAGTLLTTSSRAGYAMAAGSDGRATGAILGKAMSALREGTGMVLVLVTLQ